MDRGEAGGGVPRVDWSDGPDATRLPPIDIVRAKPGLPVRCVVLADDLVYVSCHYVDGRTTPHLIPASSCPGCRAGAPVRGYGYLGAVLWGGRRVVMVEVTDRAIRYCPELIEQRGRLRGLSVLVSRVGSSARGVLAVRVGERVHLPDGAPVPDVRAQLLHIWGAGGRPPHAPPAGGDDPNLIPTE